MSKSILLFLLVLFTTHIIFAQSGNLTVNNSCGCSVDQVQSNTVESLDTIVGIIVNVSTIGEFWDAINMANNTGGNMTILIEDGTYAVASTSSYPYITASNMVIRSASGNRDAVVLTGQGMQSVEPLTENILSLQGDNVVVSDLTLRDCGNHAIALSSDNHLIHNVRIQNTYEQMVKGNSPVSANDNTIVQCSLLEYTEGTGPQWYIGGLDIHGGTNWIVRDNVFLDIASPSQTVAEHAVHFWDSSANNIVERNIIVGCDRGIGFGLGGSPNEGGIIRNNMIVNDGSQIYNDVGIGLETSPNTQVYNNSVHIAYQNAIEYRFVETMNVLITNNLTNRPITARNGGTGILNTNYEDAETNWYVNAAGGNLRLAEALTEVVDQGSDLSGLCDEDIDQSARPNGIAYDIGAHEFLSVINEDLDGDGYDSSVDCNDMDANVNPGVDEIPYNGIDDDCDATTLDDDLDQDGFVMADDCDDTNADINPDTEEIVYNGIDDDCDATTLDDDLDQDGFVMADDCDDTNADINPDTEEIVYNGIDDDCDATTLDDDLDQDGFVMADDCDDTNADINPDTEEIVYNGIDDDCDATTLDDDLDQDGFVMVEDCDDTNADINPDTEEIVYNGIDDDCDATTLDDDLDQDGFLMVDDCDDMNADINPAAEEIPNNGIDEDCDGSDLMVGVLELNGISINIYPNPTSDFIYLEHDEALMIKCKIYSNSGALLFQEEGLKSIDIKELNAGVYLLKLEDVNTGKSRVERIIKL